MTSFWHSNLVPGTTPGNKPTTSVSEIATNKYWDKHILWIKTSQNKLLNLHSEIFQHSKIGLFCLLFFLRVLGLPQRSRLEISGLSRRPKTSSMPKMPCTTQHRVVPYVERKHCTLGIQSWSLCWCSSWVVPLVPNFLSWFTFVLCG